MVNLKLIQRFDNKQRHRGSICSSVHYKIWYHQRKKHYPKPEKENKTPGKFSFITVSICNCSRIRLILNDGFITYEMLFILILNFIKEKKRIIKNS